MTYNIPTFPNFHCTEVRHTLNLIAIHVRTIYMCMFNENNKGQLVIRASAFCTEYHFMQFIHILIYIECKCSIIIVFTLGNICNKKYPKDKIYEPTEEGRKALEGRSVCIYDCRLS